MYQRLLIVFIQSKTTAPQYYVLIFTSWILWGASYSWGGLLTKPFKPLFEPPMFILKMKEEELKEKLEKEILRNRMIKNQLRLLSKVLNQIIKGKGF